MAATKALVFELKCSYQNYHWGKLGGESEVASLLSSADPDFIVDEQTRYAELWMGTHPSGPSAVIIPNEPAKMLSEWVKDNSDKLGNSVLEHFGGSLPFLFKVLSVDKALSIQAHPNKTLAEELHGRDPVNYKDSNHKPEMAITLTDFTGLCGFRPIVEVAKFVQGIEELRAVIGNVEAEQLIASSQSGDGSCHENAIRTCFTALMHRDKRIVETELKKLVKRVWALEESGEDTSQYIGDILFKLDDEFPGDVGGFSIYFLNVMRLTKGEAIYLEANLPHAYLSGDCMECMACSDNVVRAGLTPKYIDTDTLVQMLNYNGKPADANKFVPMETNENGCHIRRFDPHIADFAVTEILIPRGVVSTILPKISSASIVICIEGDATLTSRSLSQPMKVHRGTVLFISANEETQLQVTSASDVLLFRAHAGC